MLPVVARLASFSGVALIKAPACDPEVGQQGAQALGDAWRQVGSNVLSRELGFEFATSPKPLSLTAGGRKRSCQLAFPNIVRHFGTLGKSRRTLAKQRD